MLLWRTTIPILSSQPMLTTTLSSSYALTAALIYQNVSCSSSGSNTSLSGQGALTLKIGSPLVVTTAIAYDQCERSLVVDGQMAGQWQVFPGMNITDISLHLVRRLFTWYCYPYVA